MSDHAPAPAAADGAAHATHPHADYFKVWLVLCGLLVVSLAGTFLGLINIHVATIVNVAIAFSIAIVKAYIVATRFMHINLEKKYVMFMVGTMLALMLVFLGGVSPDVYKHEGTRWENVAAKKSIAQGLAEDEAGEVKEGASHKGGAVENQHKPKAE